jgi:hypothetical protein
VKKIGGMVQPGESAVFVLANAAQPKKVAEEFRGYGATILTTTLRAYERSGCNRSWAHRPRRQSEARVMRATALYSLLGTLAVTLACSVSPSEERELGVEMAASVDSQLPSFATPSRWHSCKRSAIRWPRKRVVRISTGGSQ